MNKDGSDEGADEVYFVLSWSEGVALLISCRDLQKFSFGRWMS